MDTCSCGGGRAGANSVVRSGRGGELMSQFESNIPGPLSHDLPGFLSRGAVAAPSVGIKLFVARRREPFQRPRDAGRATPHQKR
jgi:hypothetical protein